MIILIYWSIIYNIYILIALGGNVSNFGSQCPVAFPEYPLISQNDRASALFGKNESKYGNKETFENFNRQDSFLKSPQWKKTEHIGICTAPNLVRVQRETKKMV